MIQKIYSSTSRGIGSHRVEIEVDINESLHHSFNVVGLSIGGTKELQRRIFISCKNTDFSIPIKEININIHPAIKERDSKGMDIPIAVGILQSLNFFKVKSKEFYKETAFIGELSFNGAIRKIPRLFPMVCDAQKNNFKRVIIPFDSLHECSHVKGIEIIGVKNLSDLILYLKGKKNIEPESYTLTNKTNKTEETSLNYNEVKGQSEAKFAMQIAAAGGHHVLLYGPPGSGKSMIANRIITLLNKMNQKEAIETYKIHSVHEKTQDSKYTNVRPFRRVHHTVTSVGLLGGGKGIIMPGEISLAHNGVLFLDEITEFKRSVIETLRQPLEDGFMCISRGHGTVKIPSKFSLIAAMNPCPCGHLGNVDKECICSMKNMQKYLGKLSGPFLDRIDLQLFIKPVEYSDANEISKTNISSEEMKAKIDIATKIQSDRLGNNRRNSNMTSAEIEKYCILDETTEKLMNKVFAAFKLSMRSYIKIIKIARTIADLEQSKNIEECHVKKALRFRSFDKFINKYSLSP